MFKSKKPSEPVGTIRKKSGFRKFRQDIPLYILALPGVIALLLFSYFPMAGIVLVFKDYNFKGGIFGSPWADPIYKNFRFFFNNISTAMRSTGLTVMYNLLFFIVGTIFAVAIAIMLSEIKGKMFIKISPEPYVSALLYFLDGHGSNSLCIAECGFRPFEPDPGVFGKRAYRFLCES